MIVFALSILRGPSFVEVPRLADLIGRQRVDEVVELGPGPLLLGQQLLVRPVLRHADQYDGESRIDRRRPTVVACLAYTKDRITREGTWGRSVRSQWRFVQPPS